VPVELPTAMPMDAAAPPSSVLPWTMARLPASTQTPKPVPVPIETRLPRTRQSSPWTWIACEPGASIRLPLTVVFAAAPVGIDSPVQRSITLLAITLPVSRESRLPNAVVTSAM
jgi:hypothetical protein